jgi:hypothetical protein
VVVTYRRISSRDRRLGRHVRHDPRSLAYPFDTSGLSIVSAKHTRRIPVLDQGNLGSCTGNAGIGCLGTSPFFETVARQSIGDPWIRIPHADPAQGSNTYYALNEGGAVALYSDATAADDYPGQYPPDDTGSDGLTIAKVLKSAGEISGYTHTFNLDDALKALGVTPYITGTNWYSNAMDPDQDGRVYPTGSIVGGHEWVADEIDVENERVWGTQSWGPGWGVVRDGRPGRFYYTFADYGDLLAQQGDVTIFTPLTQPAPTPSPTPGEDPADVAFAAVLRHHDWIHRHHILDNSKVAAAARIWLSKKGL